jgi:hypothetical protein
MIDTIVIKSPYISDITACNIRFWLQSKTAHQCEHQLYEIVTDNLRASWDANLSIRIQNTYYAYCPILGKNYEKECKPYIKLEFSLHKFICGTNAGKSDHRLYDIQHVIKFLEGKFSVELPPYFKWTIHRLDFSQNYDIGYNHIQSILNYFRGVDIMRKTKLDHPTSIFWGGGQSYLVFKIYAKGAEQLEHEKKRLKKIMGFVWPTYINYCHNIIRMEFGLKTRYIQKYFEDAISPLGKTPAQNIKNPTIAEMQLCENRLKSIFDLELKKILRMDKKRETLIMSDDYVKQFLMDNHKTQYNQLYSFYTSIRYQGYQMIHQQHKATSSIRTFQRKIKIFRDGGIDLSSIKTDIDASPIVDLSDKYIPLPISYDHGNCHYLNLNSDTLMNVFKRATKTDEERHKDFMVLQA